MKILIVPISKGATDWFSEQTTGEFITPPTHNFCCRFGNIKSIRPTDVNEIVLQLKNGDRLTLVKGYSSDINTHIRITTPTETTSIKWDHISEIHFMGADKEAIAPETNQVAGTVKVTHGSIQGNHLLEFPAKTKSGKNEPDKYFFKQNKEVICIQR